MSVTTYNSGALVRVIESLENPPITFFTDRFFGEQIFSTDTRIYFDVIDKVRRLAPFVSPLMEGKLMEHRGYTTRSIEPAYVKPKSVIDPNQHMFTRTPGEPLGGSLTPMQRRDKLVVDTLMEHDEALTMREEVMASELLRTGQVTITGDGYGTIVVNFGRAAQLTVALAGAARWSQGTATPLTDLETWAGLVRTHSGGAIVREFVMAPDAFAALLARLSDVEKTILFDSLRGSTSRVELGPRTAEKVKFEGTIGQFSFYTYADTYQDEDGVSQDVMPTGTVVAGSMQMEGVRLYGAIRDVRAGLASVRAFPKMWMEEDPSVEYLMTQSAPLVAALRPNASFGATVF